MVTRREVLIAGMVAGTFLRTQKVAANAPQANTAVNFAMPEGACDCHTHVYIPERFPLSPNRTFTPLPALPEEMARLHRALKVQRVVIVTSSAYGTDNSATVYGVKAHGSNARGIVVIDDKTSDRELDSMAEDGVRGARLYLAGTGIEPLEARQQFQSLVKRATPRNWHVQIFANPSQIAALEDVIAESPVPVVVDHFGGARGELGVAQPGFAELIRLVESGKAYIKLSAAYRFSNRSPNYEDMMPLARALIAANPDRALWATDWPHTNGSIPGKKPTEIFPFFEIDDGHMLNLFAQWVPDAALRKRILVDNPERLYRF